MGLHGHSLPGYPFHRNTGKKLITCGCCQSRFYEGMGRSGSIAGVRLCSRCYPDNEDANLIRGKFDILNLQEIKDVEQFYILFDISRGKDWQAEKQKRDNFKKMICGRSEIQNA